MIALRRMVELVGGWWRGLATRAATIRNRQSADNVNDTATRTRPALATRVGNRCGRSLFVARVRRVLCGARDGSAGCVRSRVPRATASWG